MRVVETYPNEAKIDVTGPFWAIKSILEPFRASQVEKPKEELLKIGFVRNEE